MNSLSLSESIPGSGNGSTLAMSCAAPGLVRHRPVLRPTCGDVSNRERVGVLPDRVAVFMADQVDLHKPGHCVVALRPGPDRDRVLEQATQAWCGCARAALSQLCPQAGAGPRRR